MSLGGGGGAAGGGGTPSNARNAPAVAYQPTAQPAADTLYQSLLGGFAGSLGPGGASAFQSMFPNATPFDFSQTPGGQAYGMAQPWFGAGTISDPNNPLYQQAQQAAQSAYGAYNPLTSQYMQDYSVLGTNNPYLSQALGSSQYAGQLMQNNVGQQGITDAGTLANLGQFLYNAFPNTFTNALTSAGQAAGAAPGILSGLNYASGLFPGAMQQGYDAASQAATEGQRLNYWGNYALGNFQPALQSAITGGQLAAQGALPVQQAAQSILNTAFDPQRALFNQLSNQVQQQQNAINAQTGVGGSPYGAGLTGQQLSNFDINWQNQQLGRQAQGLGAAIPGFGAAATLGAAPLGALQGANQTLQGLSPVFGAANQLGQAPLGTVGAGAGALGQLGGAGLQAGQLGNLPMSTMLQGGQAGQGIGNILGQGQNLGQQAAQAYYQGGMLPLQTALQQAQSAAGLNQNIYNQLAQRSALGGQPYNTLQTGTQNALQGLSGLTNLGNQQFTIPQQLANDLQSYLMLGQAASGLSGQLGNLGQQQLANSLSGIGSALGTGSNLLFGNSLGQGGGLLGMAGINPFSGAGSAGTAFAGLPSGFGSTALGGASGFGADVGLGAAGFGAADAAAGGGFLDAASTIPLALLGGL